MPRTHDRGAYGSLRFDRCERGFLLTAASRMGDMAQAAFAFDNISDVALWLVREYGPVEDSADHPEEDPGT